MRQDLRGTANEHARNHQERRCEGKRLRPAPYPDRQPAGIAGYGARQLISMAMADTWQADSLWGATDAFHVHFDFMMQTIEINGADDPNLRILRTKCRFYLEQVEALCQSTSYR